ncbi:MAG TPA: hypothetical protein DCX54_04160 [Flavobacteriales bacterium]|nr:hypothetical protein [Flavobacteriales bacterium]
MRAFYIIIAVFLLPINIYAQDFSIPETTLEIYINALKQGDKNTIYNCFHPVLNEFQLPKPIPIEAYEIQKKIIYSQKEVSDWNTQGILPPAKLGDIDLQVEQKSYGKKWMYSYLFRNINGKWKIISHAAWDQP